MGVQNLWIIDPYQRIAYTYTGVGLLKVTGERVEVSGSPIFIHLPSPLRALD